jgi:hypothetical protein
MMGNPLFTLMAKFFSLLEVILLWNTMPQRAIGSISPSQIKDYIEAA